MDLTAAQKNFYQVAIDKLWNGSIGGNTVENINKTVAKNMETVINEIAKKTLSFSKKFRKIYDFARNKSESDLWADFFISVDNSNLELLVSWMQALQGNVFAEYVKLSYKSVIANALVNGD